MILYLYIADHETIHGYEVHDGAAFIPKNDDDGRKGTSTISMQNIALNRQTGERFKVVRRHCRVVADLACDTVTLTSRFEMDSSKLIWKNPKQSQGKDRIVEKSI